MKKTIKELRWAKKEKKKLEALEKNTQEALSYNHKQHLKSHKDFYKVDTKCHKCGKEDAVTHVKENMRIKIPPRHKDYGILKYRYIVTEYWKCSVCGNSMEVKD